MPKGFLTDAQRERLNRFPDDLPRDDLSAYFTLSGADIEIIKSQRHEHTQLGFALQLCTLRYLGFVPNDLSTVPVAATTFIGHQLKLTPAAIQDYGRRTHTRTDHFLSVQSYLEFRKAAAADFGELADWLLQRALEHDKPTLLLQLTCEHLHRQRIVRPGITRLERIVSTARQQAQEETYRLLMPILTPSRRCWLDALLEPEAETARTRLAWLRAPATAASAQQIVTVLEKIAFLHDNGVVEWDVSMLNPNRLKFLAQIGRTANNQSLQRHAKKRRYPTLVAFLKQALQTLTDEVIEMYDQCLWDCYTDAKNELKDLQQRATRTIHEKLRLLRSLGEVLLDADIKDEKVRERRFRQVPETTLRAALTEMEQLIRPQNDACVDFFGKRYSYLRQFVLTFFARLEFHSNHDDDPLLQAIALLRERDAGKPRQPIPDNAPLSFIPDAWRSYVIGKDGNISRRYYELCVLWVLRRALRGGNLWVENSRRYADPETYLIPAAPWPKWRAEVCQQTATPANGAQRLAERKAELEQFLAEVDQQLSRRGGPLRLEQGKIVVTPFEAEGRPASADALAEAINERLPRVDITDVLIEVDSWVGFSKHFKHASSGASCRDDALLYLYACLLAQAGNFGLAQMADSSGIPYHQLVWFNTWHIRENTLRDAYTAMVNYHYHLPLSQVWGDGTLSSSDGQRFPVSGKIRMARSLPRYFGYGQGVTFYSWSSDQLSQYGTKPASSTIRDSTYLLDDILNNESELPILEHTTDTAGFTDVIFALFDLLGLRFSPRLRDIGSLPLYRLASIDMERFSKLKDQVKGLLDEPRILAWWDDFLRVAGSMKLGWVTASLFVQKLQAFPQQNKLTQALQEYGRLRRTIHILRWYADEAERRRINLQLNKGEALHSLRAVITVANKGVLRRKQEEGLTHQAGCLNLLTNAVIIWNTVYMAKAIDQLKKEGYPVRDSDLPHVWPTRHRHVNFLGQYHFNIEEAQQREGLRNLRTPDILSPLPPKISPIL